MKKKNQIAAAIVLRGLAKDGKFANTNMLVMVRMLRLRLLLKVLWMDKGDAQSG